MKKILILFITIITLTGCVDYNPKQEVKNWMENEIITNMTKYHFNYNGHQYIKFSPYSSLQHNTVVHDPDCPCFKQ